MPSLSESASIPEGFSIPTFRKVLNVGYVPMLDCAPLIAAQELGLFKRRGVDVALSREAGWATIRERMLHGELDASHAHASMVYELNMGLCGRSAVCLTGLMLSLNGSAISFSNELWELGVRDARTMKQIISELNGQRKFRFAVVLKFSTQNYLLRKWLIQGGIDPDTDVEIVVVPPPQVMLCLLKGHIDGFCAGEPWGSIGLLEEISWCVALTGDVEREHPEKVLLVGEAFESSRHDEHSEMIQALLEAAEYCDDLKNRGELAEMLSQPEYFDLSAASLRNGLVGPFQFGHSSQREAQDVVIFERGGASEPSESKARWVLDQINQNQLTSEPLNPSREQIQNYFRMDLYEEAAQQLKSA